MALENLRGVRNARNFQQKVIARRMGVAQSRVSAIERGSIESLQVDTLARYLASMGGRLRMFVEFDGWTIDLDWESNPGTSTEDK